VPRGRLLAPVPGQDHGVGVVGRGAEPLFDVVLALDQDRLAAQRGEPSVDRRRDYCSNGWP
jgi:hypothetical protein